MRAVGADDELHVGECCLQTRNNAVLPLGVKVQVNIVDEHDSGCKLRGVFTVIRVEL